MLLLFGFWRLSCLVFCELRGPVLWYLTVIWGNSPSLLFQTLLSPFSFRSSCYGYVSPFLAVPKFMSILFQFLPCYLFSLWFLGTFYCHILKLRESFFSCIQCTNKPNKHILLFYYSGGRPEFLFFPGIFMSLLISRRVFLHAVCFSHENNEHVHLNF